MPSYTGKALEMPVQSAPAAVHLILHGATAATASPELGTEGQSGAGQCPGSCNRCLEKLEEMEPLWLVVFLGSPLLPHCVDIRYKEGQCPAPSYLPVHAAHLVDGLSNFCLLDTLSGFKSSRGYVRDRKTISNI